MEGYIDNKCMLMYVCILYLLPSPSIPHIGFYPPPHTPKNSYCIFAFWLLLLLVSLAWVLWMLLLLVGLFVLLLLLFSGIGKNTMSMEKNRFNNLYTIRRIGCPFICMFNVPSLTYQESAKKSDIKCKEQSSVPPHPGHQLCYVLKFTAGRWPLFKNI